MNSARPAGSRRKRESTLLLLCSALLAVAAFASPAAGSLPRSGLHGANPVALAGAEAVDSGQLLAAGLETPFSLITADELEKALVCNPPTSTPRPEASGLNLVEGLLLEPPGLASRACEASFSLHLEPLAFGLNSQRGPPLEIPDLHQGEFVADPRTRIGGFGLELEDLIKGECPLSPGLRRGYEVEGWGIAEEERPDPLGLISPEAMKARQKAFTQLVAEGKSWSEAARILDANPELASDPVPAEGRRALAQAGQMAAVGTAKIGSHLAATWITAFAMAGSGGGVAAGGRAGAIYGATQKVVENALLDRPVTEDVVPATLMGGVAGVATGGLLRGAGALANSPPVQRFLQSEAGHAMTAFLKRVRPTSSEIPGFIPDTVTAYRQEYAARVRDLASMETALIEANATEEVVARALHAARRELGVKFKSLTPPELLDTITKRNIDRYGDPLGPSVDWLRNRGKSWADIIESAKRPGGKDLGL